MSALANIHSITNRILDANKNAYGELFAACDELYQVLLQITGLDPYAEQNQRNVPLDSGNAIDLNSAALCIKDLMRTKRFMDGIVEAVGAAVHANPGRVVHILYAGTGPFATLALPLTARFSHHQIQFTLLEVNEASFQCLQKMIQILGIDKYIHRLEKADATKWKLPPGEKFDIFICECMQQGLKTEPQVAICMNIVSQLSSQSILIPEEISLKAAVMNTRQRIQDKLEFNSLGNAILPLDTIFSLSKESILQQAALMQTDKPSYHFPEKSIDLPAGTANGHSELCILTNITIYNKEKLLLDESALTIPLRLADFGQHIPTHINFQFHTGAKPGIQFSTTTI